MKAPGVILLISACIASFYAAYKNIQGMTYGPSIFLLIIVGLYVIGVVLQMSKTGEIAKPDKSKILPLKEKLK